MSFETVDEKHYLTVLDDARASAGNVLAQWDGVEINWADVRAELDAHWREESPANLTEDWTGNDENEYRNLVAREIERLRSAR